MFGLRLRLARQNNHALSVLLSRSPGVDALWVRTLKGAAQEQQLHGQILPKVLSHLASTSRRKLPPKPHLLSTTFNMSNKASSNPTTSQNGTKSIVGGHAQNKEKVVIVGSGNWGSAIASIAAKNVLRHSQQFSPEVTMWIFEEDYEGKPLSRVINETHENPRYLPGIQLGENVVAEPDLDKAMKDATALVLVLPHQFLRGVLKQLKGRVSGNARAVSLIKGVDVQGTKIQAFATLVSQELGISCSSLSGANIAQEVAEEKFSESTLGVPVPENYDGDVNRLPDAMLWKPLFDTQTFRISVVPDVEGVGLCGALKNIVAVAAGFVDGLNWGSNAKAAVMRIGMNEVKDFCLEYFPSTQAATVLEESCGVADIITSSLGGRNRQVAEAMVTQGKTFHDLETEMLKGQKLQGPQTALEVHEFLAARGTKRPGGYPLFDAVWRICYQDAKPQTLVSRL